MQQNGDCEMLDLTNGREDNVQLNLLPAQMCRTTSARTRAATHTTKSLELSHLQSQYEEEINELRGQIAALETKNRKYLEIIGMTAGENQ